MDLEKIFCKISIWTYHFYYEVAKEEYDGDGSDTKELAYQYTFDRLSETGFVSAKIDEDTKTLFAYALDPAAFLIFNVKTGIPELFQFIKSRVEKNFGLKFVLKDFDLRKDCGQGVYKFTKPFVASGYDMIYHNVMTWKDAFDLEECKMTKEELIERRKKLVKEQGELMNRKRKLGEVATTYNALLAECKKVIGDNQYFLDVDTVYEIGSPKQVAHANLLFYKNGVNRVYAENMRVTEKLKQISRLISRYEMELGYNKKEG